MRGEWAVTRASTPVDRSAAWTRPNICRHSGTTGPLAAGSPRRVASEGRQRRRPSRTPRPALRLTAPLPRRTVTSPRRRRPATSAQTRTAHLAAPHPRHEEQLRDHPVDLRVSGRPLGPDAAPARPRPGGTWLPRPPGPPPRSAAPSPGPGPRPAAGARLPLTAPVAPVRHDTHERPPEGLPPLLPHIPHRHRRVFRYNAKCLVPNCAPTLPDVPRPDRLQAPHTQ